MDSHVLTDGAAGSAVDGAVGGTIDREGVPVAPNVKIHPNGIEGKKQQVTSALLSGMTPLEFCFMIEVNEANVEHHVIR